VNPARLGARLAAALRWGLVGSVFGLALLVPASYVAVEKSSEPEFCNSCHIMEPYYSSWEHSAHADIKCIECHFEPGTMGTVRGKFQAISQLAKYVTRTQGTRPWAEVSDASCVRSGCHALSSLEGSMEFGRVAFDHRPHLLETRGKRMRCVTCHSQVLVDQHFAIEESVCYTCHFQPGADGVIPERTGGCGVCHGPPQGELEVAGRPFEHAPYLARGVDCRECHDAVVQGTGTVHEQRCRSCHGEPELLAEIGAPELLHQKHVTERKVECSECHLEIQHGLGLSASAHPASDHACAACHGSAHEAALLVAAGAGAVGASGPASRMLETHVACKACHSGRSGAGASAGAGLARAGEVDCLHCHGTGFAGMLAEWQGAIGTGLAGLQELASGLEQRLTQSADARAAELAAEARADLALLERDGSRGAHNAAFALAVLRGAGQRLDEAWAQLGPADPAQPANRSAEHLPPPADEQCSACHLDVARRDPLELSGRAFRHGPHLRAAGLACSACHVAEPHGSTGHGQPAFPREECASCHHQEESAGRDPSDCSACHADQQAFFAGTIADLPDAPVLLVDKDCASCHGEPPDLVIPPPQMCVLCHEQGYDEQLEQWRGTTDELRGRLAQALSAAGTGVAPEALVSGRRALALVEADGSRGVHNFALAEKLLREALAGLESR
jgi:nitrate/TMAO reductase-like tetraheme cytochrome c subunit